MQVAAREALKNQRKFDEWQTEKEGFKAKLEIIETESPFRAILTAFDERFELSAEEGSVKEILNQIFKEAEEKKENEDVDLFFYFSSVELTDKEKNNGIYGVKVKMGSEVTPVKDDETEEYWFFTNVNEASKAIRRSYDDEDYKRELLKDRFLVRADIEYMETRPEHVLTIVCPEDQKRCSWPRGPIEELFCDECRHHVKDHEAHISVPMSIKDDSGNLNNVHITDEMVEEASQWSVKSLVEMICDDDEEGFKQNIQSIMSWNPCFIKLVPKEKDGYMQYNAEFMAYL